VHNSEVPLVAMLIGLDCGRNDYINCAKYASDLRSRMVCRSNISPCLHFLRLDLSSSYIESWFYSHLIGIFVFYVVNPIGGIRATSMRRCSGQVEHFQ
jgi:hypothetical protein